MVPIVFGRRSEASDSGVPRVNVVAIAVLLGAIVFAVIGSTASGNPIPLLVMILVGVVLMQAPRIAQAAATPACGARRAGYGDRGRVAFTRRRGHGCRPR
jgi:hypothetical protein